MFRVLAVIVAIVLLLEVAFGAFVYWILIQEGAGQRAAIWEGIETLPEATMMSLGFHGSPVWIDLSWWAIQIIALLVLMTRTTPSSGPA